LLAYTKFTFKEFRVCVRAIFAFAGGYKLGERYLLGELERRHGQSADPEAWKLGYQLSTERYEQAHGRRQAYGPLIARARGGPRVRIHLPPAKSPLRT
jgi:hypothetical protein